MNDKVKYPSQAVIWLLLLIAYIISKTFWFIRFRGTENIPPATDGPVLIAANHQTYIDPVWICIPMQRRFRFMAYDKAFEWRFVGPIIKYLGSFPVKHPIDTSKRLFKVSLRSLKDGATLVIFPEGAREFADGKMFEFKTGAMHIAIKAGVPVLPVTIRGGNHIWPQGRKYPRLFRRVEIIYHPLLRVNDTQDAEVWTERLTEIIAASFQAELEPTPADSVDS